MKEKFEDRVLDGIINVQCKNKENGTVRIWNADKAEVVRQIVQVVKAYAADNLILTLRQIHYQFVRNNWIVNHDTAYKKLGSILDDCRYAGIIDWNAIEDRGRVPYIPYSVNDVEHALQDTIDQYRLDRQRGQGNVIELFSEKDALSGILRRSTQKYHIRLVINKGYTSSSAIYNCYDRVVETILAGKKFTILYFGDHDPSGLDMIRDIKERIMLMLCRGEKLDEFDETINKEFEDAEIYYSQLVDTGFMSERTASAMINLQKKKKTVTKQHLIDFYAAKRALYINKHELFTVKAIGLTKEQIEEYDLPPNPTKMSDSRSDKYIEIHGKECWEVDALNPRTLIQIVETNIQEMINIDLYESLLEEEQEGIDELTKFVESRNNNE